MYLWRWSPTPERIRVERLPSLGVGNCLVQRATETLPGGASGRGRQPDVGFAADPNALRRPGRQAAALRGRGLHEHGVAVGVEAVPAAHRVAVGGEHRFPAAEGGDEHEQRALGQVEVRQHRGDDPEAVAGEDQERGLAGAGIRFEDARRLEDAHGGGADGDDPAGGGEPRADRAPRGLREGEGLGVEVVPPRVVGADRPEGAVADPEIEVGDLDALCFEPPEHRLVEVEACGGRRHGPGAPGVHRLVALPVGGLRRFAGADVRGERRLAHALGEFDRAGGPAEDPHPAAPVAEVLADLEERRPGLEARSGADGGAGQREEVRAVVAPGQHEQLDRAARRLPAGADPGRDDAGDVPNQEVAGPEQRREVPKPEVVAAPVRVEVEEAGVAAFRGRPLGDQPGGQLEAEVRGPHRGGPSLSSLRIERPAWESVLEEMGNPVVRADAGRFPHRMAARIARAIRSARFRGEGGPSPHPSPAALRAASAREGLSPPPVSPARRTARPGPGRRGGERPSR